MRGYHTLSYIVLLIIALMMCHAAVYAGVDIYGAAFHSPSDAGYSENWTKDNGGLLMLLVRNTGTINEKISTVRINGSDISTDSRVKWWRVWPVTLTPGEEGCVWVKSTDSTLLGEGKAVTAEVTTIYSSTASLNWTCRSSSLRIGSVVPSPDRKTLYIYVRNTSATDSYTAVETVYVNDDVTSRCTFFGQNIGPNGVAVVKVSYLQALPLRKHLNVQVRTRKSTGDIVWATGVTRLVEGWFPIGTWSSTLSSSETGLEYARNMLIDLAVTSDSNRISSRYHIRNIESSTDPAYIAGRTTNTSIGAWMVSDEPELGSKPSADINNTNLTYWNNDPNHYTYLNLCTSRAYNEYGQIADIIGEDHYAMYSAPNLISGTWVTRTAEMQEAYSYCKALKDNTEPARMWVWSQLAADGTWGTQPRDYGVDYQFWANIMAGAKGILWFKYGPGYENDSDLEVQVARGLNCARKFAQIRNLCLYSDVSDSVVASTSDVRSMALVGENAAVVVVLNNTIRTTGFAWSPGYTLNNVSGNVKFNVPDWIPIEQVKQVTENGFISPNYSVNGREVTINFSSLYGESFVYVIGNNDTNAPDPPGGLNCALYKGSNNYVMSWKEPFDNFGIKEYKVYVNGAYVAATRVPIYTVNTADPLNTVVEIKAADSAGNVSQASQQFRFGTWNFNEDGYTENWRAVRHIVNYDTSGGNLRFDVNSNNPAVESPFVQWDPGIYRYMRVRLKNSTSSVWGRVAWITNTDSTYNTTKSIRFSTNPYSDFTDYVVDLGSSSYYTGAITQLRVEVPDDGALGRMDIDSIEFKSTNPDTVPPSTPGTPWASAAITRQSYVTWFWTAVTDTGGSGLSGYWVTVKDSLGNTVAGTWVGNTTSYTAGGLISNRTYSASVYARDGAGNQSVPSAWGGEVLVDYQAPSVPGGLTAATVSGSSIQLTWNVSADACGVAGYKIFRNGLLVGTSAEASYRDNGLTPSIEYSYSVSAYDAAGNESAKSGSISAVISGISVADAKKLPDNSSVLLLDKVVTAVFSDGFYVQDEDRTSGIFVGWGGTLPAEGKKAAVAGIMTKSPSSERRVNASEATFTD